MTGRHDRQAQQTGRQVDRKTNREMYRQKFVNFIQSVIKMFLNMLFLFPAVHPADRKFDDCPFVTKKNEGNLVANKNNGNNNGTEGSANLCIDMVSKKQ